MSKDLSFLLKVTKCGQILPFISFTKSLGVERESGGSSSSSLSIAPHWDAFTIFVKRLLLSFVPKQCMDRTCLTLSWATKSYWKAGYISSGLEHEEQQQPQRMLMDYCRPDFLLLPVSQICLVLCRYVQHTWNRKCQHLQKTKPLCTKADAALGPSFCSWLFVSYLRLRGQYLFYLCLWRLEMSSLTSSYKKEKLQFEEAGNMEVWLLQKSSLCLFLSASWEWLERAVREEEALGDSDRDRTRKDFSGLKDWKNWEIRCYRGWWLFRYWK